MKELEGPMCRECGRGYPTSAIHVCEFCFGPLKVRPDLESQLVQEER